MNYTKLNISPHFPPGVTTVISCWQMTGRDVKLNEDRENARVCSMYEFEWERKGWGGSRRVSEFFSIFYESIQGISMNFLWISYSVLVQPTTVETWVFKDVLKGIQNLCRLHRQIGTVPLLIWVVVKKREVLLKHNYSGDSEWEGELEVADNRRREKYVVFIQSSLCLVTFCSQLCEDTLLVWWWRVTYANVDKQALHNTPYVKLSNFVGNSSNFVYICIRTVTPWKKCDQIFH